MLPVLFHIGSVPLHSFGLLVGIGILVSLLLAQRDAKYFKIPENKLSSLFALIIVAGIFGARFFFVAINEPEYFIKNPLEFFILWDGGLVYYGTFIFSILAVWLFAKKTKLGFLNLMDFLVPYLALGQVFGRIGCFLNGCCYGLPTNLPWGIAVTNTESATLPIGIPLHPTQLYEVLWTLFVFIILYRTAWRKKFQGQCLLLYGIMYPLGRGIIEIFRGDLARGFIIKDIISTSQGISILILIPCLIIYFKIMKKHKRV